MTGPAGTDETSSLIAVSVSVTWMVPLKACVGAGAAVVGGGVAAADVAGAGVAALVAWDVAAALALADAAALGLGDADAAVLALAAAVVAVLAAAVVSGADRVATGRATVAVGDGTTLVPPAPPQAPSRTRHAQSADTFLTFACPPSRTGRIAAVVMTATMAAKRAAPKGRWGWTRAAFGQRRPARRVAYPDYRNGWL
ncbi:MAG: hypothetical protein KGK34_01800 [Chloroflexota bacterium]|nr:hypothetical protein [Chloroflexota bacterium]